MALHIVESGTGEPVLLMPGFTEGAKDVGGILAALATRFHVLAVDLPGSGESSPIPRPYSSDLYEEDARTMAELLDARGITRARVVGFSDGGEVGLVLAARRPDLVLALAVWGAVGVVPSTVRPILDMFAQLIDHPPAGRRAWRQALVERYGLDAARQTLRSWSSAIRSLLDRGGDISLSMAKDIRCPVLLIAGEKDPFAPATEVRELGSRLVKVDVEIVPDAGHSVHDDQPEWFNAYVLGWLGAQTEASAR
jgi:pimeloyl-ACP methyl ester carboxylesterase